MLKLKILGVLTKINMRTNFIIFHFKANSPLEIYTVTTIFQIQMTNCIFLLIQSRVLVRAGATGTLAQK